ncbi:hypothetical protein [Parvularcula sp. LCG005]|uniref:hypothetical protein n=1 Tax=Parvularcula sp. LCG005 TaxID=3078805 RepID=UPI002942F80E|nr:hypothetical protein [Parvularcula sp. LCG005]WOI54282.1 hypothetical protein RUI03_04600 [Parvularcula sp. LCG005]
MTDDTVPNEGRRVLWAWQPNPEWRGRDFSLSVTRTAGPSIMPLVFASASAARDWAAGEGLPGRPIAFREDAELSKRDGIAPQSKETARRVAQIAANKCGQVQYLFEVKEAQATETVPAGWHFTAFTDGPFNLSSAEEIEPW